jgi:hypothetical protein
MINEWWIEKDVDGSSRDLILGAILVIAWRDWGKLRKTSARIAVLQTKIWTRDLPYTKQER